MLADSQYDSVGPTQFQQMNETFEDDFLAQLTSAAGVPSAPRSFSFDESVQETLRLWRQDPDTLEQAFRAPRNAANAQNWISNHLFDSQFNNEAQVALALEMRTSPFRNYGKWARLMHTVQRPAMVSLLIEQVEPQVIEGISSKIMESGFLEDDIQLLRELTSPQNGRSHVDWNPFVHQLLSAM